MNQKRFEGGTIDVFEILAALLHRAFVIILVTVLFGAAGYACSKFLIRPMYSAKAMMIVNSVDRKQDYVSSDQLESATTLINTYSIIITSETVMSEVRDHVGIDKKTYRSEVEDVSVTSVNGTQVMKITVTASDPELALSICKEITKVSPDVLLDVVDAGSVKVVEQASVKNKKVSPNNFKNVVKAALFGFALACLIIIIKVVLDNKIKGENDFQSLDLPLLGVIPSYDQEGK